MSDDYAYRQDVSTRWNDNDVYGHLNNLVHHALMDSVVNTWMIRHAGLDPHEGAVVGLVVEVHCEYRAQAAFPETLSVGLRVGHLGTSSVRFEAGIRRADGETIFEGHFVQAFVDRTTREAAPIEGAFRTALEGLQVPA